MPVTTILMSASMPLAQRLRQGLIKGSLSRVPENSFSAEMLSALVEAVAHHRDRTAFAKLFDHFAPRIKGFIRRRGVEAAQAEDLAQDVMLTVWNRARLYKREQGSVSTWIFTIARNRHIDLIRREKRPEIDANDPTLVDDTMIVGDEAVSQIETATKLSAALQKLPPDQADVLKKNFFEDKPHSEIASELGLPLGTVKSRVRLALAKLRHAVQDFE